MVGYLRNIWACRYFWLSLVRLDLRMRYRGSVLGLGWSLLQPIAMTIILCVVFHAIFHAEITHFAPYLLAGLTFWNFFIGVTMQGCQCFFAGESYIRQHPAPLAIYPLRTVLGVAFHYGLAMIVVLLTTWYFLGLPKILVLLSLAPALGIFLIMGWSLAVLAGLANLHFMDTQHLLDVGFQILFYLTPIMFPPEVLTDNHLGAVLRYNPLIYFLELIRAPLEGRVAPLQTFAMVGLIVLLLLGLATLCLYRYGKRVVFLL
ncbi:MAG: ABC transporter permease [Planctomycetes bacterium]|nr:ABC transporter permease [Planctomycetota bacterium]